jgi:nitroreductase
MNQPVIDFLLSRRSRPIGELKEPGPSEADIRTMLTAASRVPDHGRLAPWRFILYRGEARHRIGEALAALAERREGELPEHRRQQELTRFSRAPLVAGVVSVPRDHPRVPEWEMFLSGGAAAMNLLLAAGALGYGANWISNWYSDDDEGKRILGIAPQERVVGFVHIGSYEGTTPERVRPELAVIVSDYAGPFEG